MSQPIEIEHTGTMDDVTRALMKAFGLHRQQMIRATS